MLVSIREVSFVFRFKAESEPCVVDEQVYLLPFIGEVVYGFAASLAVADVVCYSQHVMAFGTKLFCKRFKGFLASGCDYYPEAGFGEPAC